MRMSYRTFALVSRVLWRIPELRRDDGGLIWIHLVTVDQETRQPATYPWPVPVREGEALVVVPNYAMGQQLPSPKWYRDIQANPSVQVSRRGGWRVRPMTARQATPSEQSELWPRVIDAFPHYERYRYHDEQETPLILLEPSGKL